MERESLPSHPLLATNLLIPSTEKNSLVDSLQPTKFLSPHHQRFIPPTPINDIFVLEPNKNFISSFIHCSCINF